MTAQPSHFLLHASTLSGILLALALWHRTPLNVWTPQALALFAIVYVLVHALFVRKWAVEHEDRAITLESIVALIVTVELIELTGGLSGPVSFLAYLLIVWLTLQLETPIALVTGLGLFAFFLPETSFYPFDLILYQFTQQPSLLFSDGIRLVGLIGTIPLALYIGHRHLRRKLREKNEP